MRLLAILFACLLSLKCYAFSTVTAVTKVTGNMSTVTLHSSAGNFRYSTCDKLTPYTYTWNVSDTVNVSVNSGATAWTLNDLTTAAIAVCIVRTAV